MHPRPSAKHVKWHQVTLGPGPGLSDNGSVEKFHEPWCKRKFHENMYHGDQNISELQHLYIPLPSFTHLKLVGLSDSKLLEVQGCCEYMWIRHLHQQSHRLTVIIVNVHSILLLGGLNFEPITIYIIPGKMPRNDTKILGKPSKTTGSQNCSTDATSRMAAWSPVSWRAVDTVCSVLFETTPSIISACSWAIPWGYEWTGEGHWNLSHFNHLPNIIKY